MRLSALFDDGSAVAWVFPGQGSQVVGMGKALADAHPEVSTLYRVADETLGYSLSVLCFDGPANELQETSHAQPALLVTELAHLEALRLRYPGQFEAARFAAGHSLGEYTALVAAGALDFVDALRLVAERGQLMSAAGGADGTGGMLAVLGLPDEHLPELCRAAGVDLANINAPGQVVLSGPRASLEVAAAKAKELGAKRSLPLNVSAAFHSRWMRPMAEQFAQTLEATHFNTPRAPVVANVTARPYTSADEVRELLQRQTYSSVRWVESVQFMVDHGAQTLVEIGPGKVLTGLIRRIAPEARLLNSDDLLG